MNNDHLISTLNDLIQISRDGEEGFRTCAEDASERKAYYASMFLDRSRDCARTVQELQDLVRALGGEPATHSSVTGTLHRQWVNLKSALTGKDDESILNECERGEDAAVQAYRKALAQDLPNDVRLIVERQYQGVIANHDRVKALRDQVKARNAA
ncbi:PA2169 family four-helix-bundle protein [Herbaspirillum autotrophicum]|uniref:PA2169 family four-helix-bundle protein n=1 Tax=Herbaspirillum autotrophicum TaxID=180195 RepID=UPI00067ACEFC|nr:PA2169 family four-helix-bundle protein [Herbaspirillum autotrophicum]